MDRCVRFRDSLRGDPQLAAQYAALKRALAARFREDREGYTEAKSTFINDVALQASRADCGDEPRAPSSGGRTTTSVTPFTDEYRGCPSISGSPNPRAG